MSFRELRITLQAPRKTADTLYGKWVMRRFSIYLTYFFSLMGLKPNQVTLISFVFGFVGIAGITQGNFVQGLLGLNLWYLFDHVDGEMARLRQETSLSGTFFDTIINFLIQPTTFFGLAVAIVGQTQTGWELLYWGLAAAVGSLMLLAIPMTEEAILFNESIKKKISFEKMSTQRSEREQRWSLFRKSYSLVHTTVTYPYVLCVMTLGYIMFALLGNPINFLCWFLIVYTVLVTLIWISQLVYKIHFRTLDRNWKPISGV